MEKKDLVELVRQKYGDVLWRERCGINGTELVSFKIDELVDYIFHSGIMKPPCNIGDTVYWVHFLDSRGWCIDSIEIKAIDRIGYEWVFHGETSCPKYPRWFFNGTSIGTRIFLSKEDALLKRQLELNKLNYPYDLGDKLE